MLSLHVEEMLVNILAFYWYWKKLLKSFWEIFSVQIIHLKRHLYIYRHGNSNDVHRVCIYLLILVFPFFFPLHLPLTSIFLSVSSAIDEQFVLVFLYHLLVKLRINPFLHTLFMNLNCTPKDIMQIAINMVKSIIVQD